MSYLIANGYRYINLIRRPGTTYLDAAHVCKDCGSRATRLKLCNAEKYISKHLDPKIWKVRKYGKYHSGNNYVITDCYEFLSDDNAYMTKNMENAKVFDSVKDAEIYMEKLNITNLAIITDDFQLVKCGDVEAANKRIIIDARTRNIVYEENRGICGICGAPVNPQTYTIDHIVPLSRGGKNELSNYQLACGRCNKIKGNYKDPELARGLTTILANQLDKQENEELSNILIRSIVRSKINSMTRCFT